MTYGESNAKCPMTSRDANGQGWLTYLLSICVIKVTATVAYNKARRHVNITEILKNAITYQKQEAKLSLG